MDILRERQWKCGNYEKLFTIFPENISKQNLFLLVCLRKPFSAYPKVLLKDLGIEHFF